MKLGLVLEGGAMRGLYTAGVLDVMMEQGLDFDGVIGVSAGAAFGCNYKSKQIGRTLRYNKKYSKDPRYAGLRSLIKTGNYYNAEFAYGEVPFKLDIFDTKTFSENPVEFYVVCTDVETGNPFYKKLEKGEQEDIDWIRASASMPVVSKPVLLEGHKYLDGGISDSIPIEWFRSIGYTKNLVVLTRPEGYRKKPSSKFLTKLFVRKYPKIAEKMLERSLVYNKTLDILAEQEKDGTSFVLCPSKDLNLKRTEKDPEKFEELYRLGRADAMKNLDKIRRFMEL